MDRELDRLIRRRARHACEYCQLPQTAYKFRFQIDHVIAQQHRGKTAAENLCLACPRCNASKGPNLSGVDPATGKIVRLFNPRRQRWASHFEWDGAMLCGKTATGRATIEVLAVNHPSAIAVRAALMNEGLFFCDQPSN